MRTFILIFTFTSLLLACTDQKYAGQTLDSAAAVDQTGITGGDEVTETSELANTAVMIRGLQAITKTVNGGELTTYKFDVCTGVFISDTIVLTAAHCIFAAPFKLEVVYSNDIHDFSAPTAQVLKVIKHPDYAEISKSSGERMDDDIALIKIAGKKPVRYRTAGLTKFPATQQEFLVTALGYGRTAGVEPLENEDPLQGLGVLRTTPTIAENFDPTKNFFRINQRNGHGICSGDSGGPGLVKLKDKYYVIGVANAVAVTEDEQASAGPDFDKCHYGAVYVSVQYYANWISKSIQELK